MPARRNAEEGAIESVAPVSTRNDAAKAAEASLNAVSATSTNVSPTVTLAILRWNQNPTQLRRALERMHHGRIELSSGVGTQPAGRFRERKRLTIRARGGHRVETVRHRKNSRVRV